MTLDEIKGIALENQRSIASFDSWAQAMERRVDELDKSKGVLREVELALRDVVATNRGVGEKLQDMKESMENISRDNQVQHEVLSKRVRALEEQPGNRWQALKGMIITALVSGGVGYMLAQILGVTK